MNTTLARWERERKREEAGDVFWSSFSSSPFLLDDCPRGPLLLGAACFLPDEIKGWRRRWWKWWPHARSGERGGTKRVIRLQLPADSVSKIVSVFTLMMQKASFSALIPRSHALWNSPPSPGMRNEVVSNHVMKKEDYWSFASPIPVQSGVATGDRLEPPILPPPRLMNSKKKPLTFALGDKREDDRVRQILEKENLTFFMHPRTSLSLSLPLLSLPKCHIFSRHLQQKKSFSTFPPPSSWVLSFPLLSFLSVWFISPLLLLPSLSLSRPTVGSMWEEEETKETASTLLSLCKIGLKQKEVSERGDADDDDYDNICMRVRGGWELSQCVRRRSTRSGSVSGSLNIVVSRIF